MHNLKIGLRVLLISLPAICLVNSHARFSRVRAAQPPQSAQTAGNVPHYNSSGALVRPKDFETWVFVGTSTGLSYEPGMSSRGSGEFKNVYITPEAYKSYLATSQFPEKTMLALAVYDPSEKVSPAKAGYFEGEFTSLAFAVKDHAHTGEGWSYYDFSGGDGQLADSAKALSKSRCYDCHHQHGLDDNVFVQFYPVLRKGFNARKGAAAPAH
ncbi:MAG TPA: cytochrome P460 family protein [Candidatus Acidoferrales bacterium]|nr:cytochrome P460 family protein [Candidatus Acidoferrales bacterium]